jgi:transposase
LDEAVYSVAFRARRIILRCAAGTNNAAVARNLKTTGFTVRFWRNRFIAGGVNALLGEPRASAPRKLGDDAIERVVKLTLESVPKDATHWSTRSLADKTGNRRSVGFGERLDCNHIAPNRFNFPVIRF